MANKKKARKRPYVPPQRAGAPPPGADADENRPSRRRKEPDQVPSVAPKAAERRERKSEVRLQKEKELRRYQRSHFLRRMVVGVLIIAVLGGGIGYLIWSRTEATRKADELISQATAAATAAGCGPVETVEAYDPEASDQAHVDDLPTLDTYRTTPPASGPHSSVTLRAGIYDEAPAIGEALHSLEHGAVIIWYDPNAPADDLEEVRQLVRESQDHTIMAPYDFPDDGKAGRLPEGKQIALTAWHRQQVCDTPSAAVTAQFMSKFREPTYGGGEYEGEAPEAGILI